MFYSHEILTSRQYGVATVWLVATTSRQTSTRRVNRKAIQEVDVRGACGKIIEPGAPIALRLQGSLLYGVARVHNQQFTYLVADAKRTQDQMRLFFRNFSGNQIDPEAGKARPENLVIEDDPAFDPNMPLPHFDLESLVISQSKTQKTSSQMSPASTQMSNSQSPGHGIQIQLDLNHSSSSSAGPVSPFGLEGLSVTQKDDDEPLIFPNEEDPFGGQGDWGIEIDADGNVIEPEVVAMVEDEPQLPPLPPTAVDDAREMDQQPVFDDQVDVVMQEEILPDAEPFPERQRHEAFVRDERASHRVSSRRGRKLKIDRHTQVGKVTLKNWQNDYLKNCTGRAHVHITARQAKRNAMLLTFGYGIGDIGRGVGVPNLVHPLAVTFSGDVLFKTITGIDIETRRGTRRTSSEAFQEEDDRNEGRRVRPRLMESTEEQDQARQDADDFVFVDDPMAEEPGQEVGREAAHPMSDHLLSSTLQPWNRGSSAVPGSSIRAPHSAQRGRVLSSPLARQGDPQDIVRYSDGHIESDYDGFPPIGLGSNDDDDNNNNSFDAIIPEQQTKAQQQTDELLAGKLDMEGNNFLTYVQEAVAQDGERRRDDDCEMHRKWLAFDDLFVPRTTPRHTAAQAFYHTLCLVTKGRITVEQDGEDEKPFGAIWLGAGGLISA
ncbi:Rec8 like protein-domain-containing protein [Poronia punctata]|nr:Rec8 like protein-domain-containing protein [Poronia punctata]